MDERIRPEYAERVRDFYRNQGAAKEQQRIIELLEQDEFGITGCGCCSQGSIEELINVIKGENK